MFTFTTNRSGPFSDPKSEQIKQVMRQAKASNTHAVKVSQKWFNSVKPVLAGLAHPNAIGANSASVLGVTIQVDDQITNENEYEVA